MAETKEVWIFNGANAKFPSAVFLIKEDAVDWIRKHGLTGVLTKYSVDISVYEWAVESGNFKAKPEEDSMPGFIGGFSSAAQEHVHLENGFFD
jgi:hypothetical protein